jgi:hypothetical protein
VSVQLKKIQNYKVWVVGGDLAASGSLSQSACKPPLTILFKALPVQLGCQSSVRESSIPQEQGSLLLPSHLAPGVA